MSIIEVESHIIYNWIDNGKIKLYSFQIIHTLHYKWNFCYRMQLKKWKWKNNAFDEQAYFKGLNVTFFSFFYTLTYFSEDIPSCIRGDFIRQSSSVGITITKTWNGRSRENGKKSFLKNIRLEYKHKSHCINIYNINKSVFSFRTILW